MAHRHGFCVQILFFDFSFSFYVTKRKLSFKEEKERSELEINIKILEEQAEVLTAQLNSGITDHNKLTEIAINLKDINSKIDEQTFRWLELSE